jgi:membrane protein required for colicin V production
VTAGVSWVDWAFLAVAAVSIALGLWRGLVLELMMLAGWVVAYFGAAWAAPHLAPSLPIGVSGSALNHSAAVLAGFLAVLIVWALLARVVRWLITITPLTVPDRLLGGLFGAARALLLGLLVATVVELTPSAQAPAWRTAYSAQALGVLLHGLKPVLPAELGRWLPA